MSVSVVGLFEAVEVNAQNGKFLARQHGTVERGPNSVIECRPVGQVGEGVMPRHVLDDRFGAPALRDGFVCSYPSTVCHRLVHDADRTSIYSPLYCIAGFSLSQIPPGRGMILLAVAVKAPGVLMMVDEITKTAARFNNIKGQAIHLDIALIADDDLLRRVEQ